MEEEASSPGGQRSAQVVAFVRPCQDDPVDADVEILAAEFFVQEGRRRA